MNLWVFIKKYSGYIVISLFYLWVWLFPMARPQSALTGYIGGHYVPHVLSMLKVFTIYFQWLFFPTDIVSVLERIPFVIKTFDLAILFSAVLILAVFFLPMYLRKKNPEMSFA